MKLNLGCGEDKREGYINIDIRESVDPDIAADVRNLPYDEKSVDEILAYDVLEHIHYTEVEDTLDHWASLLVRGGHIIIRVPDFEKYIKDPDEDWKDMSWWVFGRKEDDVKASLHKSVFTKDDLIKLLGDRYIKIVNVDETSHPNMIIEGEKIEY